MNQEEMITIEYDGDRKIISKKNLPLYQETAEYMYNLAIKKGVPEDFAKKHFTLRVIEET